MHEMKLVLDATIENEINIEGYNQVLEFEFKFWFLAIYPIVKDDRKNVAKISKTSYKLRNWIKTICKI